MTDYWGVTHYWVQYVNESLIFSLLYSVLLVFNNLWLLATIRPNFADLICMNQYKEIIWHWYIFENRTLQDTHSCLSTRLNADNSQHIPQGICCIYKSRRASSSKLILIYLIWYACRSIGLTKYKVSREKFTFMELSKEWANCSVGFTTCSAILRSLLWYGA